jgi:heme-degrading monooxygenase HmoA
MFVLHVDMTAHSGRSESLTAAYRDIFSPAIRTQRGFLESKLLLARTDSAWTHRLVLAFDSEAAQKQWAATDLHGDVWARMSPSVARFSVTSFDLIVSS